MNRKERIEDLGKLSCLLKNIFFDEFFDQKYWNRPKDAWSKFNTLDEDQKENVISSIAYGLERIRDEIADCRCIADGDYED